jgi:hypothetical protein
MQTWQLGPSLLALTLGCSTLDQAPDHTRDPTPFRVPLKAAQGICRDLSQVSACWPSSGGPPQPVERRVPEFSARSAMGFRCSGQGKQRTCRDRLRDSQEFSCREGSCKQPFARVPDAGEWTCADASGASLCLAGGVAAGVQAAREPEAGFSCGWRTAANEPSQRLCIDFAPDFPDGVAENWNCHYEHDGEVTRVCKRERSRAIGADCTAGSTCPLGSKCLGGRCLPTQLRPTCWLDRDCASNQCRLGRCI